MNRRYRIVGYASRSSGSGNLQGTWIPMCAKTILVVDDEPHIRYLLDFKLRQVGFTVITANNGAQAFDLAAQHRPDLVVTDFQMPAGSGLDLCKRLRANPGTAEIPALMLTARAHRVAASLEPAREVGRQAPARAGDRILVWVHHRAAQLAHQHFDGFVGIDQPEIRQPDG